MWPYSFLHFYNIIPTGIWGNRELPQKCAWPSSYLWVIQGLGEPLYEVEGGKHPISDPIRRFMSTSDKRR